MKAQLRVRTLLIPASKVLRSIGNLEKRTFTDTERKFMVIAVLEEISFTAYAAVPWDYSYDKPPYQGMAYVHSREALTNVSETDLKSTLARLKADCAELLRPYLMPDREWLEGSAADILRHAPLVFDHGVSYSWYKNFLQVTWVRPTIDYREMSATTYFHAVHAHYLKRVRGISDALLVGNMLALPMSKFLTSEYEVTFS